MSGILPPSISLSENEVADNGGGASTSLVSSRGGRSVGECLVL